MPPNHYSFKIHHLQFQNSQNKHGVLFIIATVEIQYLHSTIQHLTDAISKASSLR